MASTDPGRVALITGGASGMGLEVAKSLIGKGWQTWIVDMNPNGGETAKLLGPSASFRQGDVTDFETLRDIFESLWEKHKRLDFVFANAGISERTFFYETPAKGSPAIAPDMRCADVLFKGVVNTTVLARHYFRQNEGAVADQNLIMTSSSTAFYPSELIPVYSAAKAAVLGFMRGIATLYYEKDQIRVNALCPGPVRTAIIPDDGWNLFDEDQFTPKEKIFEVVHMILESKDKIYGKAVETSAHNYYFRDPVPYCDEKMEKIINATRKPELFGNSSGDGI